jgi:hypothetical protein
MSEKTALILPDDVHESVSTDPRDLVVISIPKMGKGCILGDFSVKYNALVFDLEKGGYEYISARKISTHPDEETTDLDSFYNYINYRNTLLEQKGKYKFLIIDGLSDLDKLSEIGGTLAYMDTIIGKNYNKVDPTNPSKTAPKWKPSDPNFKSVLALADGAGYQHTRRWFLQQIEFFRQISPYRLYAAHIVDKYIKEDNKDKVMGSEIALTGQLKRIFASKVTSLAKLFADGNKRYLNFEVLNDSIIAGSRAPKLKGKILISEMDEKNKISTYWESIYTKECLTSKTKTK